MNKPIKDCIINEYFLDTPNPLKHQLKYCKTNCRYKCITHKEYKKI
jgi:hypothetical protein